MKNWCFLKAPYVKGNNSIESLFVENAYYRKIGHDALEGDIYDDFQAYGECVFHIDNAYHIAMEIRLQEKGDYGGVRKTPDGAINDAATQICRGLNGFVEFLSKELIELSKPARILPVIITTAELFVSDVDISHASLKTGNIDLSQITRSSRPWVYYQYHMSPGLKHSRGREYDRKYNLPELLDFEYIRTIPIVNSLSIREFLLELKSYFVQENIGIYLESV